MTHFLNPSLRGMSKTHFYRKFWCMNSRCYYIHNASYKSHWDKWIRVCAEWLKNFEQFYNDMYQSYLEHVKLHWAKNTSLDRIDSTKDYSKDNCRWATYEVQNNNLSFNRKYEIDWELLSVSQLARKYNIKVPTLFSRLNIAHDTIEEALAIPYIRYNKGWRIAKNNSKIGNK